jgi:hypothetical protein
MSTCDSNTSQSYNCKQRETPDPNHDLTSTIAYYLPDADPIERGLVHSITNRAFTYCPEKRLTATTSAGPFIQSYHGQILLLVLYS